MRSKIYLKALAVRSCVAAACALLAAGCATRTAPVTEVVQPQPPLVETPAPAPPTIVTPPPSPSPAFRLASWNELPGWRDDNLAEAWPAFIASCKALAAREGWRAACAAAARLENPHAALVHRYFEEHFAAYQALGSDGGETGLMTGYYEPLLRGSRAATARYRFPIYAVPDDLLTIDADAYPELKGTALRGRIEGRRVVPYYDRARIESGETRLRGKEIAWLDDAIDVFFLHVQGSGRIVFDNGAVMRVGFADHNGRPYRSIGRVLIERGELTADQASMQGIKAWAAARPNELRALLDSNPRFVFFRELPVGAGGPPGALGVALTPRRSLAVDARHMPLGAPVYVATTWPNTARPLNQLMMAQDTGGAIQGPVRGDFFWGAGDEAGREAGRMRSRTRMWLLLPKGIAPPGVQ